MPAIISKAMASKSDDLAYLQGTYTMTDPKTKKPMTDKGKYLTVFKSGDFPTLCSQRGSFIKQDYENVSVSVYGSAAAEGPNHADVIIINWPKRGCPAPH